MNAPKETGGSTRRSGRLRRIWLWFFVVTCALAGVGFFYKLYEFFWNVTSTEGFEFAGVHLVTYIFVAGGFVMLLAYGFLKGHFSDIESPKHDMLERERRLDELEYGGDHS